MFCWPGGTDLFGMGKITQYQYAGSAAANAN